MIKDSSAKLVWDDQEYTVSLPEALILKELINNNNELVSRKRLVEIAWGSSDFIGSNSLPVAISSLRKVLKIKNINIVNEPKVGYRLEVNGYNVLINSRSDLITTNIDNVKPFLKIFHIGIEMVFLFFILLFISDFLVAWVFVDSYESDGINIYELGDKKLILGV